jgi:hypothetical protein
MNKACQSNTRSSGLFLASFILPLLIDTTQEDARFCLKSMRLTNACCTRPLAAHEIPIQAMQPPSRTGVEHDREGVQLRASISLSCKLYQSYVPSVIVGKAMVVGIAEKSCATRLLFRVYLTLLRDLIFKSSTVAFIIFHLLSCKS